jgi:integrin beta 3
MSMTSASLPDPRAFAAELVLRMQAALAPVLRRLEVLEQTPPRDGRDGLPGLPGTPGLPGEPGRDGKDGVDGFALDRLDAEALDGGRTLVVTLHHGESVQRLELRLATMIYRGVFRDGETYQLGDTVTWAGSLWHCNAPTGAKPGDGSKDWTLTVKKGRDGKDGVTGKDGEPGPPGRAGRDLTQMAADGSRY